MADLTERMLPISPDEQRRDTAFHEAAHAVVGHEVGAFIRKVSIEQGHANFAWIVLPGDRTPRDLRARRQVLALLAGHIGETIVMINQIAPGDPVAGLVAGATIKYLRGEAIDIPAADMPRCAKIVLDMCGGLRSAEQYIKSAADESEHLVREQWPAIESVVDAVLAHDPLSGDKLRETIRPWAEAGTLGPWPWPLNDAAFAALERQYGSRPMPPGRIP